MFIHDKQQKTDSKNSTVLRKNDISYKIKISQLIIINQLTNLILYF